MGSVKVRINSAGARAILQSSEMLSDVASRGSAIADAACSMTTPDMRGKRPFETNAEVGMNRARAIVYTNSYHGVASNSKHHTLLKALDAGR